MFTYFAFIKLPKKIEHNLSITLIVFYVLILIIELLYSNWFKKQLKGALTSKLHLIGTEENVFKAFNIRQKIISLNSINAIMIVSYFYRYIIAQVWEHNPGFFNLIYEETTDDIFMKSSTMVNVGLLLNAMIVFLIAINFDEERIAQRIVAIGIVIFSITYHLLVILFSFAKEGGVEYYK